MASAYAEVTRMFGDIVKMTQASVQTRDEAEGLEALGIDLITIADLDIDEIRAGAPNTFVSGSQTMVRYVTSAPPPHQAFVWIWLPGKITPVVAGRR